MTVYSRMFHFLPHHGKQTKAQIKAREAIAKQVDAYYTYIKEPTGEYKGWYTARNYGDPIDSKRATEAARLEQLNAALLRKAPRR